MIAMRLHTPSFVLGASTTKFLRKYWYIGIFYVLFYLMFWMVFGVFWLIYRGIKAIVNKTKKQPTTETPAKS